MYNRERAVQYAEQYWNQYNPAYRYFAEDDCTNFVSQVLYAGGLSMEMSNSPSRGWWYRQSGDKKDRWSYSWTVANALYQYLNQGKRAVRYNRADQLTIGDVICYDWEGDGRWNHNTVVTLIDGRGIPFVSAHSYNAHHRYWGYQDSPAYTPNTRYAFFHIL